MAAAPLEPATSGDAGNPAGLPPRLGDGRRVSCPLSTDLDQSNLRPRRWPRPASWKFPKSTASFSLLALNQPKTSAWIPQQLHYRYFRPDNQRKIAILVLITLKVFLL